MSLPKDFHFSQGSMQDFIECRRRFYLRYIKKIRWPAVQTEPVMQSERMMRQGAVFHHTILQYFLGIPEQQLLMEQVDNDASTWWQNFLKYTPLLPGVGNRMAGRFPEHTLLGTLEGYHLIAKYDLIVVQENGSILIYDWKTSLKKPRRAWLEARMQTVLYPFLLMVAGKNLFQSKMTQPDQVSMVYWFAAQPEQAEIFRYNQTEFEKAQKQITEIIRLVNRLAQNNNDLSFPLTDDEKRCAFCVYRSLCGRGIIAGSADDETDHLAPLDDINFSYDQISEISY